MKDVLQDYFDEQDAIYKKMLTSYIPYKRNVARGHIITLEHFESMCVYLEPHLLPNAIDEETPELFYNKLLNAKDGREEKKYFHAIKSFEKIKHQIREQVPTERDTRRTK